VPVFRREESEGELRKIKEFRKWERDAIDAGKMKPAWDAGRDPQE